MTLVAESVISPGGEVILEKGDVETWEALRVTMTAETGEEEEENAVLISAMFNGEPWIRFTPARGLIFEGVRTRAVAVCPRARASSIVSVPVRPLPPMKRICILGRGRGEQSVLRGLFCWGEWLFAMGSVESFDEMLRPFNLRRIRRE